jgi:hypothetical protein
MRHFLRALGALAVLLCVTARPAAAAPYLCTRIADTTGPFRAFFTPSINNAGEVAFRATLADGREGIYRATPIPEPSSLALLLAGALMVAGWRRRRRMP